MHIYIYILNTCIYIKIHTYIHIYIYTYTYIYIYIHMYIYIFKSCSLLSRGSRKRKICVAEGAVDKRSNARYLSPHDGCQRPEPRAPALPRPARRQHWQAARLSPTRAYCHPHGVRVPPAHAAAALALMSGLPRPDLAAAEGKGEGWGGRVTVGHQRV